MLQIFLHHIVITRHTHKKKGLQLNALEIPEYKAENNSKIPAWSQFQPFPRIWAEFQSEHEKGWRTPGMGEGERGTRGEGKSRWIKNKGREKGLEWRHEGEEG